MGKSGYRLILHIYLILAAFPTEAFEYESATETRLESDGELGARASAGVDVGGRAVWVAIGGAFGGDGLSSPTILLATPHLDLGPIREAGLLKELSRPCGIGSMRQQSAITLDRSLSGSSVEGGVVRMEGAAPGSLPLELFALRRAGLAPDGTRSAGAHHSAALGSSSRLSTAAEVTVFGSERQDAGEVESSDWFAPLPRIEIPYVTRLGIGFSTSRDRLTVYANGGVAVSDRTRPAGFCSSYFSYHGRRRIQSDRKGRSPLLVTSVSLSGGAVNPDYVDDDGRYAPYVAVMQPAASVRLPGLSVRGSYRYRLSRLPLLPVVWREQSHSLSISSRVDFGLVGLTLGISERLRFTEEGRALLATRSAVGLKLPLGPIGLSGQLVLNHSNDADDRVDYIGALELAGNRGHIELSAKLRGTTLVLGISGAHSGSVDRVRVSAKLEGVSKESMGKLSFSVHLGSSSG